MTKKEYVLTWYILLARHSGDVRIFSDMLMVIFSKSASMYNAR